MSKREELIEKYAADLRSECDVEPDMDLLEKIVRGLEPAIYNRDSATVSASSTEELNTIKQSFLIGKLGLEDDESLMGGIQKAITTYGRSNRNKHRAVIYYLLVKHFGKEGVYA